MQAAERSKDLIGALFEYEVTQQNTAPPEKGAGSKR
jgi:hypothetical protein